MATTATLRWRRSAAQLHALTTVEREIRATDPNGRRKYLREFREAFPSYHSTLGAAQLEQALAAADIVLVSDYHALAACQRYCAELVSQRAARSQRPLVFGVEAIFARDQHILGEWQRGEIDERELRERIRYDIDWQYDWPPFYELLARAHAAGAHIYGLDCTPRGDMRKISLRDRHAASRLATIRQEHPTAQIIVLFGESHLAPSHLPAQIREKLPNDRVLTVLQNLDALYWKAAGERRSRIEAVRVSDAAIGVFNATPLEKYESYRWYLNRWRCERRDTIDMAPVFYNLIESLLRFIGVNKYKTRDSAALIDLLPEVRSHCSADAMRRILLRKHAALREIEKAQEELQQHGSCYFPRFNMIFVSRLNLCHNVELAARFVLLACQGMFGAAPKVLTSETARDRFYRLALENALVYFGSRVLYPARPPVREKDYYPLYPQSAADFQLRNFCTCREYVEMLDVLVLHKDYEAHGRKYWRPPQLVEDAVDFSTSRVDFITRELGLMLGTELYDAYLGGKLAKHSLRSLYFRKLWRPGVAHSLYFTLVQKVVKPPRMLVA